MTASRSLDVVMPVYNESEILTQVLGDIRRQILDNVDGARLLVIDDRSTDDSLELLHRAASEDSRIVVMTNEQNLGHGRSVRRGFDTSEAEWVLQIDSDGQIDLGDFATLWAARDRGPLVIGTRVNRSDPRHRLVLTRVTNLIVSALCGRRIVDANVPFKLVGRQLMQRLLPLMPTNAFAPSIMLVVGACADRRPPVVVTVRHLARPYGASTLRPLRLAKACLTAAGQTLQFTWRAKRTLRRG